MIVFIILFLILLIYLLFSNFNENFKNNDQDLYIIISKKVTLNMYSKYSNILKNNLIFISDNKPDFTKNNIIYYSNKLLKQNGFTNSHNNIEITAWDKVFYYLKNFHYDYKNIWIIEDDSYLNEKNFVDYIKKFDNDDSDLLLFGWYKTYDNRNTNTDKSWPHWHFGKKYFKTIDMCSSITQFVRISPKLLNKILNFQEKYKKLLFHEISLCSICKTNNLKLKQIKDENIFLSAFDQKHNSKVHSNKYDFIVYHPYKKWYDN